MSDVALRTAPITIVGRDRQLAELAETRLGDTARVVRGRSVPLGGDGLAYVPITTALREMQLDG